MSLLSFDFFVLVGAVLIAYYLLPLRHRWIALLAASALFYLCGGVKETALVILIAVFSFYMAHVIQKAEKGRKKRLALALAVVVLLSVLAFIKICGHYNTFGDRLIVPIGLSYFSLSIIGYLLDVYWRKEEAERNFGSFLTFVLYFPKIVQGPISRHKFLHRQLTEGNHFNYEQFCFGLQLAIWGAFKKIVLADRMNIFVSRVYSQLDVYAPHGLILLIAMLLSALQLYCDFSGYTDMARGISQMFGVELEQNFNRPFFAQTASEFWQRWHMSLSSWFKDYLFLPVSRSHFVKELSKKMGTRCGAAARKKTMMICSTAVVWVATGLWHGTGLNYMVWGLYWGGLIIFAEVFSDAFGRMNAALHINTAAPTWRVFRMLRTGGIFVVGKMISAQSSLHDVKTILHGVISNIHFADLELALQLGLNKTDCIILLLGLLTLFAVSLLQENGIRLRRSIAGWNAVPRWFFYSFSLTVVLFIGLYGVGYDTSTFAYQFF